MTITNPTTLSDTDGACIQIGYAYPTSPMADDRGWPDGAYYWCTAPSVFGSENDDVSGAFTTPGEALADAERSRPELTVPVVYRDWVSRIEVANGRTGEGK